MAGFSYRGKHIDEFGDIYYIPDASERGAYALPFKVEEEEINGHDGAYYSGCHVQPRQFNLRCYYDGITKKTREDMLWWFGRNTSGRLIFDDRDYVYYDVRPNSRITMEDHLVNTCYGTLYQGIMTIPLKAYNPYGHLVSASSISLAGQIGYAIVGTSVVGDATFLSNPETVILTQGMMPNNSFTTSGGTYLVYNPGTERTPLKIQMMGTAENGLVTNLRNGQNCAIKNMTAAATTAAGKYLTVDAETGRVVLGNDLSFEMHDYGYIWLEPGVPATGSVTINYVNGSSTIYSPGIFNWDMINEYVYLNGGWHKIVNLTNIYQATIADTMSATGSEITDIVAMNEIQFTGFTLTAVNLSYVPRMR